MKILFFTPFSTAVFAEKFPPVNVPRESRATWSENITKHLSKLKNTTVYLATISRLIDRDYIFEENGIKYFYLKHPLRRGGWVSLYLLGIFKLRRVAKEVNPNIIHVQGTESCYGLAAVTLKYPVLVSLHAAIREILLTNIKNITITYFIRFIRLLILPLINNYIIKKSSYIHTQTDYLKNYYSILLKNKIVRSIDLPVNEIFFSVKNVPKENTIIFVSNSFRLKGADKVIKIAEKLKKLIKDFKIIVIGPNKEGIKIDNKILKKYCLENKFILLGQLDPEEIAHQLSFAKVSLQPTKCDTYSMVSVESLCAGVPVVASNIMGLPYVIDNNKDGFLIDSEDINGFAEKISYLLKNENIRRNMSKNAREKSLKRWNTDSIIQKMLQFYNDISSE